MNELKIIAMDGDVVKFHLHLTTESKYLLDRTIVALENELNFEEESVFDWEWLIDGEKIDIAKEMELAYERIMKFNASFTEYRKCDIAYKNKEMLDGK